MGIFILGIKIVLAFCAIISWILAMSITHLIEEYKGNEYVIPSFNFKPYWLYILGLLLYNKYKDFPPLKKEIIYLRLSLLVTFICLAILWVYYY